MTENEEQALKRLEVNVQRLVETIQEQRQVLEQRAAEVDSLRQELAQREAELETLRLEKAQALVANQLVSTAETGQVERYLGEIIAEVERCVAQLKTE